MQVQVTRITLKAVKHRLEGKVVKMILKLGENQVPSNSKPQPINTAPISTISTP